MKITERTQAKAARNGIFAGIFRDFLVFEQIRTNPKEPKTKQST